MGDRLVRTTDSDSPYLLTWPRFDKIDGINFEHRNGATRRCDGPERVEHMDVRNNPSPRELSLLPLCAFRILDRIDIGGSSSGRTTDSDSVYLGSNPSPPAKARRPVQFDGPSSFLGVNDGDFPGCPGGPSRLGTLNTPFPG